MTISVDTVSIELGGKTLVQEVNLECAKGTLTALAGPNGAGKSTLLGAIAGDLPVAAGTIRLGGRPIEDYSVRELAQLRSVFPQGAVVRFSYSVRDVVAMGRAFRDLPPEDDEAAIHAALDAMEIIQLDKRDAMTLSGGEHARMTFARVLAQDTPIMLLDEPTAALDLRHQERLLQISKELAGTGRTVVVVLHDLNLASAYADQIVLMADGRISAAGAPWAVLEQERIEAVYRQSVRVMRHPDRDCPVVLTV